MGIATEPALDPPERDYLIFATCECCGNPIYAETDYLQGEMYVELTPGEYIHEECMNEWIRQNRKEAKI